MSTKFYFAGCRILLSLNKQCWTNLIFSTTNIQTFSFPVNVWMLLNATENLHLFISLAAIYTESKTFLPEVCGFALYWFPPPAVQDCCWILSWLPWLKLWSADPGRRTTAWTCSSLFPWTATPSLPATPPVPPCVVGSSWLIWCWLPRWGCWCCCGRAWWAWAECCWADTMWLMWCLASGWDIASIIWWRCCGSPLKPCWDS